MVAVLAALLGAGGGAAADPSCELNGRLAAGQCVCDPPWHGPTCGSLLLTPADPSAGYRATTGNAGERTSSWGASTVLIDGVWHAYAAEITLGCGMSQWTRNSRIVHSTSTDPLHEVFVRRDEVAPVFAHEPSVSRAPNGSIVLYYTASPWPSQRPLCTACAAGSTPLAARAPNGSCATGGSTDPTLMMHAASPYGPWSKPVTVLSGTPGAHVPEFGGDTNLDLVILPNGTALGMMRVLGMSLHPKTSWASIPHLVTAADWADPSSYRVSPDRLFPMLRGPGLECAPCFRLHHSQGRRLCLPPPGFLSGGAVWGAGTCTSGARQARVGRSTRCSTTCKPASSAHRPSRTAGASMESRPSQTPIGSIVAPGPS